MAIAMDGTDAVQRGRQRWEVWKSPEDQPRWARPALLGIAVIAATLYAWNIANAGFEGFYSVAVKSMSVSWKAFIFGAFDPRATITLDKLAGSFVPQAISARIFGFHAWSLALPQVIEGVISVLVMYRVVRRWTGPVPGLLGAAIFALTPVAVSMFGHSMEDGLLTMCLVLAADSCQRAMLEGRLRSLLWAAFWVGIGFQAKMLQAWIVLPALAAGYLYAAPLPLRRRLRDVGIAGAAALAVSLSWIALYTVTPAGDRPYIDGSTNNSAISMVFGYNGLGRFGVSFPGSVVSMFGGGHARAGQTGALMHELQRAGFGMRSGGGWGKLAGSEFGPQISWLFPLAFLAMVCGLLWCRRDDGSDRTRTGGFLMWGTWLVSYGFVFSAMKTIPHTAYVASLAPAIAALSGAGIVMFWREYATAQEHPASHRQWLLPVAVITELGWSVYLWRSYRGFFPAARWAIVLGGLAAIAVMIIAKVTRPGRPLIVLGALVGAVVMIAAPAAWAGSALELQYDGSEMNATAGPAPEAGFGHLPPAIQRMFGGASTASSHIGALSRHASSNATRGAGGWGATSTRLTGSEKATYNYLRANRDGASYLMATGSWSLAAPYIIATGAEVLPMGGFSGTVPSPTLERAKRLVATGQLRYFLLSQPGTGFMGRQPTGQALAITTWVRHECTQVADAAEPLYRCGGLAAHHRADSRDHAPARDASVSRWNSSTQRRSGRTSPR
ncbi:MAG TPA: glycosyltransferase family 39 protein [Streptosporangiaceae bacterium]|nr:glycosyltransferase family 39 protein [Streptosporangiaceae bacterium]